MDDKFKKALDRLQSIAKEEGWEKPASKGTSGANRPSEAAEMERSRLLSAPRYTAARERFGKEATSRDYFDQNYRKVLAGGTNEEKQAFRDTYHSFLATEAYDRELADFHKRMQDTIRSGGFGSADEAVNFIFNNADGTSRTPHLDKMDVEPLHEISFDKEALEQSIRLQWDTKWAEDNAAKNEAALGLAVNAEKIAQVNARGSLIDESTIPGAGVMASKQNLYATPPADIYSEGRLWAGAKSGNDAVMRTDTDGTAKRTQDGYKPAPDVEALTPEALSETPVKSPSMTKEELYAGIDEALYNNDYRTACQYQFQLIEGAVKQSGDEYIQDMVHSEGSQKATAALMQMAIAGDLPKKMMDPDVRVELAEYEMLLKEAYDIGDEELGGFIGWLDGVLGMDGKLVEAQSNDGIGVSNVAMWALDHTAYAITDLVDKFVGSIITGAGKLFGNEQLADYGAEFANEMNNTLAGHNEVLMENGTPLEIMAGIAGSEMVKMQQMGGIAKAFGNASAAVFGDKLKFLTRMISSAPFAAESGLREMWDSYNEGEDYLTSAAAGLGAAAVTAAMSQWDGILKNIEASNMPYVEEVVEKLALVPGSGVVAGLSRWGNMFGHFMVNIGKTAVNEAVQEPAENIVTEAVTGLIKGENPLERDWQEYGRELTADALMGGLISIGSSVSVFPSYANSVKVAESLMKKSAITAEDANTLVNAVAQDLQDPTIAETVRERATKVVTEAKAGEMMASGAIDGSAVEAAKKSVSKATERFESAQRKNELTQQKLADATRRMNENPADPKATNEVLAVIEEKNQAQEEMVTAQREAQEAQGEYEAAKANVQETALAMAQTELAAVANQNAIVKAERAAVRSAARESGNVTAMGIADFTSSNFADATPEEQQRIDAIYREIQREMTPEAQESRNRFMQQLTKKYGVQFDVVDTTKGGTALRYNGSYNARTGRVEIDQNATQSDMLYGTVLHELTHRMEQSESYQEFADALIGIAYSDSDEGQLDRDIAARMKRYNTQLEMMAALDPTVDATPLTEDEARREIVADLTRKILYGDEESINRLAAEKPSVARRILETIKNFISKLTGIAREDYSELDRARELFETALGSAEKTADGKQYDLLDPNEYARLRSNMNDKNYRGYQFVERKNGGSLVAMDNVLVYTDANGEPEAVLDVYDAGNVELVNAIEQDAIELEQEGYDLETQRSILHSVYGEESADFREGGKRNETSRENGAGAGRNARGIRQGDRGEVSAENREITSDGNVIAEETPSGTVAKDYSLSSWTEKEKATARQQLLDKGFDAMKVERWIDDVNSVAATIAADKDRLDYIAADNQVMLKQNQEYVKTLDASTLCAKRLLYQGTFDAIQHLLPNTVLTSDDLIGLRNMLAESGYESPCGVCYVESRRRQLGKFAGEWLEGYNGEYKPRLDEVTTSDGLEKLRHEHPKAYQDFIDNMNSKGSNNPKVVQLRTEYRGDVRSLTKGQIKKITEIGGLRVQSFSDFETPHLIDMMQAVLDMSAKGLTSQAYTKVPNFAAVFGDTGIKINLSLIAEGNGLNPDGTLAFSPTEGMDIADALALRDRYSKNVGTIIVGVSREHVLAAMKDPQIDYIIPFHKSGWGDRELKLMGLDEYENFTDWQNERRVVGQYKNGKFKYKNVEENFYPIDYWDYSKSGDENARIYLRMCEEDGRIPKFDMFLSKDEDGHWVAPEGYWKTLIDFKMYDNDGVGAPQEAVQPNFNMEEAMRVLGEYKGGANTLPVAQDIVERFVREYKEQHPRTQYSLPSEDVLRDMIRQYMQLSAMGPEQQVQRPMGERQFARQSVQQSEAMPDWLKQEMYQNPEELNYEIDTNMEQAERGYNRIVQNGFEQERDRLLGLERFSADDTAEANVIMAIANHNGDAETLLAIASKYNREGTKAGQELQARKLFSKMSPTGAKAMVAGSLENTLQEELRLHAPKKKSMDSAAEQVRSKLLGLPEPEQASYDSRYGVELNGYQRALIDQYKLGKERRPGINYNRATVKQRMLEAILATPYPMNEMNGLTLVQRLEYMNEGLAVVTTADLDYIGAQLGLFVGAGAESGGRDADLAIARAYEAFGNITPVSGREKLRTWRYMSMLGTLTSPMRNVIGNVAQNTMNAVSHGIAVGLDTVIGAASGQRTVASLNMKERADGWKAFAQETKDTFRDFFVDKAEVQNRQGDKYNTRREGRVYQSNALETFRNVESFLMSFGDRNFWKKAYVNSLSEQQKLLDRGLLRNEDGTTPTYDQMVERAENDANFATFTEDNAVRDALSAMKRIPGIGDALDYIMPFTGVPTNIVKRMWQYSPMGFAQTAIQHGMRAVRGETFEQQRFVEGMARGLTGSAMVGLGMMLGSLGVIKMGTQDEDDAKKRGLQTAVGAQYTPYVYNPFNNEYMSLSTFAPAVSPIIMGVAVNSIFEDDEDAWNAMMSATTASMDQILDASFMSGLKDVFEGYGSTSENIRDTLIESAVSQNVPALIGQLANAVDPYVRDTKDKNVLMAALKSGLINKLPWIRNELLPEKVDVTGQSVMTKENWRNFIDPFTTTDARDDAVVNELLRLSEATGASDMLPVDALSGTKDTLASKGNSITLDPFQKEAYKKRYGELWYKGGTYADANGREIAVTGVDELIGSKEYQELSDDEKAKKVKAIVDLAKSVAVAEAFGKGAEGYETAMETVSTKQKSINKSSIADEVSRGNYKNLGSYVKGLEYAGTKASSIKSTVTSFMKEHYKQASEAQRKEIRRILYQTGLYDDYNFEANWLKK